MHTYIAEECQAEGKDIPEVDTSNCDRLFDLAFTKFSSHYCNYQKTHKRIAEVTYATMYNKVSKVRKSNREETHD